MNNNTLFVLGGNDGEMAVIKQLLSMHGIRWIQPNTGWGNHIYGLADLDLKMRVKDTQSQHGLTFQLYPPHQYIEGDPEVIFVECHPKDDWPTHAKPKVIDHHGERSGEPASILQVLDLLMPIEYMGSNVQYDARSKTHFHRHLARQISPVTLRWVEIVAANDCGYIPAMMALGATDDEIKRVRAFDRSAQGITSTQEVAAEIAVRRALTDGRLTVVKLPHNKTATVTDRLYGQYDQLLILSEDGEVNFFGDGELCAKLKDKFGGWNGGSGLGKKGDNAFWGGSPVHDEVEQFICEQL